MNITAEKPPTNDTRTDFDLEITAGLIKKCILFS